MKPGTVSVLAMALLVACASQAPKPSATSWDAPVEAAPTLAQIADARVEGVLDHPVTLAGGVYLGEPFVPGGASRPSVRLWQEIVGVGDLDGQPGDEAAVLLSEQSGGSGERVYLAVARQRHGKVEPLRAALVGDRTKVRALRVQHWKILLEVVEAGSGDALCCPAQLAQQVWRVRGGRLRRVATTVQGRLSIAILEGTRWSLVEMDDQSLSEDAATPTLEVADHRLAGFSGCHRYRGDVTESSPGHIAVTGLAAS